MVIARLPRRGRPVKRRMQELLSFDEHTVNHPLWALLNGGWKFNTSYRHASSEKGAEARLRRNYRAKHGGELPPLMRR